MYRGYLGPAPRSSSRPPGGGSVGDLPLLEKRQSVEDLVQLALKFYKSTFISRITKIIFFFCSRFFELFKERDGGIALGNSL